MIRYVILTLLAVASFVNAMLLLGFALETLDLPWWNPFAGVLFAVAIPYLAAMLRQQAEQIEAIKADAERLDLLEKTRVAYGFEDMHEGNTWYVEGPFNNVRAAIDAMKGKS